MKQMVASAMNTLHQ